jgi:hypothetical protein
MKKELKKKEKKMYYPKRNAIYSIQFWYSKKEGCLMCTETANNSNKLQDNSNMYVFGLDIAKSKYLETKDKVSFASFCRGYLSRFK